MLKRSRVVFGIMAAILAVYGLLTDSMEIMPFMYLLLGLMFLVMGISEYKEKRKLSAYLFLFVAGFNLFGSVIAIKYP
ncbi:YczI family protein [Niallia taxi]|uniref:DUF3953 domain-containing protein n=1 Tax=Niallia taxi TaxID=2499688 RepID=A0A437K3A5_9BACI|nr:YczI family protein [Niallia taxi]MDK8643942.1 YczI family protein [Niallia taxi]MED4057582.1 YczI family protein [Niallia taxi]RVT56569.1 DUF3953 domain-containing protein [Niallia taxi]